MTSFLTSGLAARVRDLWIAVVVVGLLFGLLSDRYSIVGSSVIGLLLDCSFDCRSIDIWIAFALLSELIFDCCWGVIRIAIIFNGLLFVFLMDCC